MELDDLALVIEQKYSADPNLRDDDYQADALYLTALAVVELTKEVRALREQVITLTATIAEQ